MHLLTPILILVAAFLAVFLEAVCEVPRCWIGAQIDLLPGLMVFASLSSGLMTILLLSLVGGIGFDALSANPMGATVLPLFLIGLVIHQFRHLILREQTYAQWVLGLGASAALPLLTLGLLLMLDDPPVLGLGSLWQWLVMSFGGAALTPLWFRGIDQLRRALSYQPVPDATYRSDREIKRGRI